MTHQEFIDQYLQDKQWHITDGILYVYGFIDLFNEDITSLPDNLVIKEYLFLYGTLLKMLPNNLTVSSDLWVRGTSITRLPDDLILKGEIYADCKLRMGKQLQLDIIKTSKDNFYFIKYPTKKAKMLQKLLWEI